jgi:predicted membrane-bound spermidine synthase
MYDDLKFFGLAPLFGLLGALSTALAWRLFAVAMLDVVPDRLQVLSCLVVGLVGPTVVWITVWITTRIRARESSSVVRNSASVGLGLVLAAQLGFYIPLGFFAIAFH